MLNDSIDSTIPAKECIKCNETKIIANFYKDKRGKDGYRNICKACQKVSRNERHVELKSQKRELTCKSCKESKTYDEFFKDDAFPHGHNTDWCITCTDSVEEKILNYRASVEDEKEKRNLKIAQLVRGDVVEDLVESIILLKSKIKELDTHAYDSIDDLIVDRERGTYAPRSPARITASGKLLHPLHGHLYILQEREFVKSGEQVYKVGQTQKENPFDRLKQYPNNSNVIDVAKVYNPINAETELLSRLNALCAEDLLIHRTDIGREYFEGELSVIQACMHEVIHE
jgi:hypothetical protein